MRNNAGRGVSGFSLVEMLIYITILMIIFNVLTPLFGQGFDLLRTASICVGSVEKAELAMQLIRSDVRQADKIIILSGNSASAMLPAADDKDTEPVLFAQAPTRRGRGRRGRGRRGRYSPTRGLPAAKPAKPKKPRKVTPSPPPKTVRLFQIVLCSGKTVEYQLYGKSLVRKELKSAKAGQISLAGPFDSVKLTPVNGGGRLYRIDLAIWGPIPQSVRLGTESPVARFTTAACMRKGTWQ